MRLQIFIGLFQSIREFKNNNRLVRCWLIRKEDDEDHRRSFKFRENYKIPRKTISEHRMRH